MSKSENTHKMTIRLSPLTEFRLERDCRLDGSRSKNEFIERAITHYQNLLEAEQNEMLPAAIQSAIDGRLGMFEDRLARLLYKLSVTRLLHHMNRVFREQTPAPSVPGGIQIDRKRLRQLREKKMAMGHKADDYEEQSQDRTMTMG